MPRRNLRPAPADWLIISLACLGQFIVVLDVSIVNVALASIQADLGFGDGDLQWVVTGYALTFAGFLLLGGRLADLFGRKRVFLLGLGLFVVASLACGLAQTPAQLIAARAVQGLGGAVLSPATLTILTSSFSGAKRATALGVWSAFAGAGGATGSLVGGLLVDTLSWRWIFLVNVPVGLLAITTAALVLHETRDATRPRLDVIGAITVTAGLASFVLGVGQAEAYGWATWASWGPLLTGVVLLGVFLFIEARVASAPLVPLDVFRSRAVSGANLVMLCNGSAFFGFWFLTVLYLQRVLGYSPLEAGLALLPHSLAIVLGAQLTSRIITRIGNRPMILIGVLISSAGFFLQAQLTPTSAYFPHIAGAGMMVAIGIGLTFPPLAATATGGLSRERTGLGSGLINTSRQMGGSLGLAVLATLATIVSQNALAGRVRTPEAVAAALTSGYTTAFTAAGCVLLLSAALSFVIPWQRPQRGGLPAEVPASRAAS